MPEPKNDDRYEEKDFYKKPGGGLRDPQGAPPLPQEDRTDDETTEPTEELPPDGLGKKSPDQNLEKPLPRHRGG